MQQKRKDYISWDEYFMGIAIFSGQRSKDPSTQVGACIVNSQKRIIGIGYNGLPIGCNDDDYPWEREGELENTKYPYIVHSEANAILNSFGKDLQGSTIYVTLFPCNECAKLIIQSGIKKIIYLSDKYKDLPVFKVSRRILSDAGVVCEQYEQKNKEILIKI